jgi:chemotaxis protein methyltransferase CheR
MALAREHVGDHRGAVGHDQTAVYLDPAFAMPHLHLGLMLRRQGDQAAALPELRQAVALLAREDASRVLLFGGGFSREALIELGRRELRGAGARGQA